GGAIVSTSPQRGAPPPRRPRDQHHDPFSRRGWRRRAAPNGGCTPVSPRCGPRSTSCWVFMDVDGGSGASDFAWQSAVDLGGYHLLEREDAVMNTRRASATLGLVLAATLSFAAGAAGADSVGIVVRLGDAPVARYPGGVPGFARTSVEGTGEHLERRPRAGVSYRTRLAAWQDAVVSAARKVAPDARVLHRYQMVLNGVALRVAKDEVDAIAAIPGVVAVYPDELHQPTTDRSPAFIGAKSAWKALGGQDVAGEGGIVGMIDTGVWPEHPSFSDPDPEGNAYPSPGVSLPCQFGIGAHPGPAFTCNNKLIGAYRFMAAYDACVGAAQCAMPVGSFTSARDDIGHGTHTSSTAAGNGNVPATLLGIERGKVSGIAPRAHVIAYRICGEDGCLASDAVAAIEQAIDDGVDVINYSIGGSAAPYADPVELAFLDAYAAGIFVAASADNSGPAAETVIRRAPWVTT